MLAVPDRPAEPFAAEIFGVMAPVAKVPIGAAIRFAYRSVFGRLGLILEIGWIPLLAVIAAMILPAILMPARRGLDAADFGGMDYAEAVVVMLSLSAFAVRWHQSLLLGDPRRLPASAFFRGWWRFLAYMTVSYVVLGMILGVAAVSLNGVALGDAGMAAVELAALLVGVALGLAILRFALLFPAAACGRPLGPVAAWRLMRGNSWRLALASLLTALPVTITTGVVMGVLVTIALPNNLEQVAAPPIGVLILIGLLETATDVVLVALGASLFAAFYREIVVDRGTEDGSATA